MCDDFHVSNETDGFKLTVGMNNGTAGNIYNTYILIFCISVEKINNKTGCNCPLIYVFLIIIYKKKCYDTRSNIKAFVNAKGHLLYTCIDGWHEQWDSRLYI